MCRIVDMHLLQTSLCNDNKDRNAKVKCNVDVDDAEEELVHAQLCLLAVCLP